MFKLRLLHEPFSNLSGDLLGGIMTAVVALPIAMAFGVASGLGAAAGLYSAIACGIFAALFGGTKGQQSGPTGPMTVVATSLAAASPGHPQLIFAAVLLGGILQIALGKLKAGQFIRYIPHPVVSGFMTGIGLIIIVLHINPFFGVAAPRKVMEALQSIPDTLVSINTSAFGIAFLTLLIIFGINAVSKRIPASLVALVIASITSVVWNLDVPRIGSIPTGIPIPAFPLFDWTDLRIVLTGGLSLAVLGSIDSLLTSVVVDRLTLTRHNSDKELVGQGLGNIVSGMFGGLPGAGSTIRTLANIDSGGKTPLSGIVYGALILAVVMGLGSIASHIPHSVLAAILIMLGISIIDWRGIKSWRKHSRSDVVVMITVIVLTVLVDLIVAVGVGVTLACILFAKNLADMKVSPHGRLDTLESRYIAEQNIPKDLRKSIYIYAFHGPLFFGEAKNFAEAMSEISNVKYVILKFYSLPFIDQTWAQALDDSLAQLEAKEVSVLFVGIEETMLELLRRTELMRKVPSGDCFSTFAASIEEIGQREGVLFAPF